MRFSDNDSIWNGALALAAAALVVLAILTAELVLVPHSKASTQAETPSLELETSASEDMEESEPEEAEIGKEPEDSAADPLAALAGRELLDPLAAPSLSTFQSDLPTWLEGSGFSLADLELTYVGTSPDGKTQVTLVTDGSAVITGTESDGKWAFNAISITPEAYEGDNEVSTVG